MQLAITLVLVGIAAFAVGRGLVRTWAAPGGCGAGCGKCAAGVEEAVKPGRIPLDRVCQS